MRALVVVLAALAITAAPAQAKGCGSLPKYPRGNGYITSLHVKRTGCKRGGAVARAFTRCRYRHGGIRGHCSGRVKGYACDEGKRMSIEKEFDAAVACERGRKRVNFTYQQNT